MVNFLYEKTLSLDRRSQEGFLGYPNPNQEKGFEENVLLLRTEPKPGPVLIKFYTFDLSLVVRASIKVVHCVIVQYYHKITTIFYIAILQYCRAGRYIYDYRLFNYQMSQTRSNLSQQQGQNHHFNIHLSHSLRRPTGRSEQMMMGSGELKQPKTGTAIIRKCQATVSLSLTNLNPKT